MVNFSNEKDEGKDKNLHIISVLNVPFDEQVSDNFHANNTNVFTGSETSLSTITTETVESTPETPRRKESWHHTTLQVAIPFFIAGIGTIGAGLVLGIVQHWRVYTEVPELIILIPALLGLKGNLDMCLASRLSTQANLGNMNSKRNIFHMIVGNIALVQIQAIVAAATVTLFSIAVSAVVNGHFDYRHMILLASAAIFTATTSCFILDFVMIGIILFARHFGWNPDNVATPFAASIGDVVSLSALSFIASTMFKYHETHMWVMILTICAYVAILPFWIWVVLKNKYTRPVLFSGWVPVISALFISGLGGLVLSIAIEDYSGFVVFQPIINGIGGNLVSVQASRISTMLHQTSLLGILPPYAKTVPWPWRALFYGEPSASTSRILICMSIPGQILFLFVADFAHQHGQSTVGAEFALTYITVSTLQIMILLYIAHLIIHLMWSRKVDPDNSAIPYLTALGDLIGSSLLLVAFIILETFGIHYEERVI